MHDDELFDMLADLDPAGTDPAPAPGSPRHQLILEAITMNTTLTNPDQRHEADINADVTTGNRPAASTQRSTGMSRRFLAVAAALVAVTVGAAIVWPGDAPSAEAAVASAADNLAGITSLRAEMTITEDGARRTLTGEFSGRNVLVNETSTTDDGSETTSWFAVIDGTNYFADESGQIASEPATDDGGLAPFGEASAAVIRAALTGSNVTDLGTETIEGRDVRHVELAMTDTSREALRRLTPSELAWFELEYPDGLQTLDVYLDGELIHQLTVTGNEIGTRAIRYFDFNADITITVPDA